MNLNSIMARTLAKLVATAALVSLVAGCATTPPFTAADYRLAAPLTETERAYLGLPAEASGFQLEDIHCEILVVDCFDMYCHLCQTGAKHVNELYRLAQERGLGSRVKFIGLGVGDTPLEVATYKEKFKVPFPVFPDRKTAIVRRLGELRLPNLIVLRNPGGRLEVIHRSPGPLRDPAEFLSHIQGDLTQTGQRHWINRLQAAQPTCGDNSKSCREPGPVPDAAAGSGPAATR